MSRAEITRIGTLHFFTRFAWVGCHSNLARGIKPRRIAMAAFSVPCGSRPLPPVWLC
jgi:hypothetical protein